MMVVVSFISIYTTRYTAGLKQIDSSKLLIYQCIYLL